MRVRIAQYGKHRRMNQQKPKKLTKMETTRPYGENRCVICQNGYKNLRRILWMKVFQLIESAPEPRAKEVWGKHRNCGICMRTNNEGSLQDSVVSVQNKNFSGDKGACKNYWSPIGNPKSFTLTIHQNLAKPVKISP